MIRIGHIDFLTNLVTVAIPATAIERAQRIIARIARVPLSSVDVRDIVDGRLTLAEIINKGARHNDMHHT